MGVFFQKRILHIALAGIILATAGCAGIGGRFNPGGGIPSTSGTMPGSPAAGPTSLTLPTLPAATETALIDHCTLLDGHDIASLYARAEVMMPIHKEAPVSRPIFSTESASGSESSCLFYGFSYPGAKNSDLLQITYWIDIPDPAAEATWGKAWADEQAKSGKVTGGIGNEAIFQNGRLTFRQDGVFVTIEAIGTALNTNDAAGASQQLEIEEKMAQAILGRLKG